MADATPRIAEAGTLPASAGTGWPAALALALLLPLLLGIAAWMPVFALATLDTDNLAIVWIDGDPAAQAAARRLAATDPAFGGGGEPAAADQAPAGCAPAATTRLFFAVHRIDQTQATRLALEALATAAGARVCASNYFELNVPVRADREPLRWLRGEAWQALVLIVLPAGLAALAFAAPFGAAARARLRADAPPAWQRPLLLAAAAMLALATIAALASSGVVAPLQRAQVTGLSPMFALHELALLPFLHQLALRTWLFAQLSPRLPLPIVALVSIAAGVVAALPVTVSGVVVATALATACTGLYVRTRSLLPAVALHAAAVALQDAMLLAG